MLKKIAKIKDKLLKYTMIPILGCVYYARFIGVEIGERCRLYISDFGSEPFLIRIGSKVTIAPGVKLITHDGSTWLFNDGKGRRYQYRRIEIGNNVFVGMNSVILPGIKIGDNVVIGAGAIITKSVPSGVVVAGNPAKIITTFKRYEEKALTTYVSESEMLKTNYKSRVLSAVDESFKQEMT